MADPMRRINVFVGRWELIVDHRAFGSDVRGVATFVWREGVLLEQRLVVDHPGFRNALLIIGGDDQTELFNVCYSDDRGKQRIYQMSVEGGVWRLWRQTPKVRQRFVGAFSADHDQIEGVWEVSRDGGETWDLDFRMRYRRLE